MKTNLDTVRSGTIAAPSGFRGSVTLVDGFPNLLAATAPRAWLLPTDDGFAPLHAVHQNLSAFLGRDASFVEELARWNHRDNARVTLVVLPAAIVRGGGIILAPSAASRCYQGFVRSIYSKPYRDFFYNVAYEALHHADLNWAVTSVGVACFGVRGMGDVMTCQSEAFFHLVDAYVSPLSRIEFFGCGSLTMGDLGVLSR